MSARTIRLAEDEPNDVILFQRALERASLSAGSVNVIRDGEEAISQHGLLARNFVAYGTKFRTGSDRMG